MESGGGVIIELTKAGRLSTEAETLDFDSPVSGWMILLPHPRQPHVTTKISSRVPDRERCPKRHHRFLPRSVPLQVSRLRWLPPVPSDPEGTSERLTKVEEEEQEDSKTRENLRQEYRYPIFAPKMFTRLVQRRFPSP